MASTAVSENPRFVRPPKRGAFANLWVAVVLWIASNAFMLGVATIASWEGIASYSRVSDFCKWDCGWYGSVLQMGYWVQTMPDTAAANWPFHPLFPLTAYPFYKWFHVPLAGSVVWAGKLELLLAIYAFLLMVSDEAPDTGERFRAASLVAFNPYVIYAHAGYAEPLYFACIAFAFYFAARRGWIMAGGMGGLASATRFVGVMFLLAYVTSWLKDRSPDLRHDHASVNRLIGLLLCPLGTALFMLYMWAHMGDAMVQQHTQVSWGKVAGNPLHTLHAALWQHHWPRLWAAMVVAALLLSVSLWRMHKPEMAVFLAAVVLIPISATYVAAARYIWWQPPLLYAIYCWLRRYPAWWIPYIVFTSGMAAFMVIGWFSGHNFVV